MPPPIPKKLEIIPAKKLAPVASIHTCFELVFFVCNFRLRKM